MFRIAVAMIRFTCPSCKATLSVPDEQAGKTGKCPKCQAAFEIPAPDSSASPPLPSAEATVEVQPCPGCQGRLWVAPADVGRDVECPHCKTVFQAKRAGRPPAPPPAPLKKSEFESTDDSGRPRRPRDDD